MRSTPPRFAVVAFATTLVVLVTAAWMWRDAWTLMYRLAFARLDAGTWADWVPDQARTALEDDPSRPGPVAAAPKRAGWKQAHVDEYAETVGVWNGPAIPGVSTSDACREACNAREYCAGYAFAPGSGECRLVHDGHTLVNRERGTVCMRGTRWVAPET